MNVSTHACTASDPSMCTSGIWIKLMQPHPVPTPLQLCAMATKLLAECAERYHGCSLQARRCGLSSGSQGDKQWHAFSNLSIVCTLVAETQTCSEMSLHSLAVWLSVHHNTVSGAISESCWILEPSQSSVSCACTHAHGCDTD